MATTTDLTSRLERRIFTAMAPTADHAGLSVTAATIRVALEVCAEARGKGFTATQVRALRLLTTQVGGRLQRDAEAAGVAL